jgi:hypothetical protein
MAAQPLLDASTALTDALRENNLSSHELLIISQSNHKYRDGEKIKSTLAKKFAKAAAAREIVAFEQLKDMNPSQILVGLGSLPAVLSQELTKASVELVRNCIDQCLDQGRAKQQNGELLMPEHSIAIKNIHDSIHTTVIEIIDMGERMDRPTEMDDPAGQMDANGLVLQVPVNNDYDVQQYKLNVSTRIMMDLSPNLNVAKERVMTQWRQLKADAEADKRAEEMEARMKRTEQLAAQASQRFRSPRRGHDKGDKKGGGKGDAQPCFSFMLKKLGKEPAGCTNPDCKKSHNISFGKAKSTIEKFSKIFAGCDMKDWK